jgi:hypothetical protein
MKAESRPPFWLWLNLLCVDAPVVALVWQDFLTRCYPSSLSFAGRVVLALTVWAIYLADRLIDIRQPMAENESSRHRFCRQNRGLMKLLLAIALVSDILAAALWLRAAIVRTGLIAVGAVVFYFMAFVIGGKPKLWKQVAIREAWVNGRTVSLGSVGMESRWAPETLLRRPHEWLP